MKVEKMLMLIMMTCSLLLASSIPVLAAEKTETLEDVAGDVVDYETQDLVTENAYIEIDNIDITKVEYTITNETIEFTLEVKGNIENKGSLDELNPEDPDPTSFNINTVTYTFELITSEDWYTISYANNSCQITDGLGTITNLTDSDFSVSGNTLTVSFNWNTTGETFDDASANVQYIRMILDYDDISDMDDLDDFGDLGIVWLADQVPNGPLFVYTEATNLGEAGKEIEFDGTAIDGQPPYTWNWEFGDGETSTDPDPTHTYDTAGEYDYILTVTDAGGTSESDSGNIEIVGEEDDDNTPGFELIIAIAAIGLIFLWKRKR